MRVNCSRENRGVAGETLRHPNIFRCAIHVGAGGVAQRVEAEDALEAGPLLPSAKQVPRLAGGEAAPMPTQEEGRARFEGLATTGFVRAEGADEEAYRG